MPTARAEANRTDRRCYFLFLWWEGNIHKGHNLFRSSRLTINTFFFIDTPSAGSAHLFLCQRNEEKKQNNNKIFFFSNLCWGGKTIFRTAEGVLMPKTMFFFLFVLLRVKLLHHCCFFQVLVTIYRFKAVPLHGLTSTHTAKLFAKAARPETEKMCSSSSSGGFSRHTVKEMSVHACNLFRLDNGLCRRITLWTFFAWSIISPGDAKRIILKKARAEVP